MLEDDAAEAAEFGIDFEDGGDDADDSGGEDGPTY